MGANASNVVLPEVYTARKFNFAAVNGLSRKSLDLHLGLYQGYVKQSNALRALSSELSGRAKLNESDQFRMDGLTRRLAFEHNGVVLHELFFEQLDGRPAGSGPSPGSVLTEAMDSSFGGLDRWQNEISQLAETRGVGWVVSAWSRTTNRLMNFWISEHHLAVPVGLDPIAVFDIWEHAYLLDFAPSARKDYLGVLFRNMDWTVLERRCLV